MKVNKKHKFDYLKELTKKFNANSGKLKEQDFYDTLYETYGNMNYEDDIKELEKDTLREIIFSSGYPVTETNQEDEIKLETFSKNYKKESYVFVDIETNGSFINRHDIIELGAIKYQDGKVVDKLDTFVFSKVVPDYITDVTGIKKKDLKNAPKVEDVLLKFKEFIGDSIFVAHGVEFDYSFIKYKFNSLLNTDFNNRFLCTLRLAKNSFELEKYGLDSLNENLGINHEVRHRAYADAYISMRVFEKALDELKKRDEKLKSVEDLIAFSYK